MGQHESTSSRSVAQAADQKGPAAPPGAAMQSKPTSSTRSGRLPVGGKSPPLGFDHFDTAARVEQQQAPPSVPLRCTGEPGSWWRRTRMHVALLGLAIAVVNCYAQATFCIAIVEMVYPADYVSRRAAGEQQAQLSPANVTLAPLATDTLTLQDHSCPIEAKYRDFYDASRFPSDEQESPATNNTAPMQQALVDVSNRFAWDATQQGLLLGAFAFGTAPLQILGGRLSEIYGSKWVLLTGCVGTALTNLAMPHIAHLSFPLLLANRFLMGVAQAGMEPGVMCLLADWLTPQEASLFISMSLFAICVGAFLGLLGSSLILGLGYGWPMAFYVSGGLNLVVGAVWCLYADSWPQASKYIGRRELEFITSEQRKERQLASTDLRAELKGPQLPAAGPVEQSCHHMSIVPVEPAAAAALCAPAAAAIGEPRDDPVRAPWLSILSTRSVWAFIICKISVRWCADVIQNMMPTYLANVLHLSININGLFMSISTALFTVSAFVAGWLANELFVGGGEREPTRATSQRKTRVRKAFQSVASFGSAICLVLMSLYDCDIVFSMSMLLLLSACLVMGSGGELQIPYDMTSRYPGTLHGMACTLSVSGWLAPPLIGLVLGDQPNSRSRWSVVWNWTAALTLVGGLAFVLFADSSPRDFDATKRRRRRRRRSHASARPQPDLETGPTNGDAKPQPNTLTEGYVNGALNSSSCESSPKQALRGPDGATDGKPRESRWRQASHLAGQLERGQLSASSLVNELRCEESNFSLVGEKLNHKSISISSSSARSDHRKTIGHDESSGALIEDHELARVTGATMIDGAAREPARANERVAATTRPDLRLPPTLLASETAAERPAHKHPAGQHPPDGAKQTPDSQWGSTTHL